MKKISTLFLGCMISLATYAYEPIPTDSCQIVAIDLSCQIIDMSKQLGSPHRTPVQIPNVYIDQENAKIYFEDVCYECTLEIVVPGTDSVAYTYSIPDGDNVVTLPEWLSGQYELHIHRGNFCFWGVIEL